MRQQVAAEAKQRPTKFVFLFSLTMMDVAVVVVVPAANVSWRIAIRPTGLTYYHLSERS